MSTIAVTSAEQCIHVEYFYEYTDGRWQKRCLNTSDHEVQFASNDTKYRCCKLHAIFYVKAGARIVLSPEKEARLQELHMMPYRDYLQTPEWKERSLLAKKKAGNRCQVCNTSSKETQLHTHHRTYERRGNENDGDLIVLCEDCHEIFHENGRLAEVD